MTLLAPALVYVFAVAAATGLSFCLGVYTLIPERSLLGLVREFLRTDWRYLGVAWIVTLLVNELAKHHRGSMFTDAIIALEGDAVAAFQAFVTPHLVVFFAFVYLVCFPLVVHLTYFKLKYTAEEEEAYRYVVGYVSLLVLAAPFFVLFPVRVAGLSLPSVDYLLFDFGPVARVGIRATDTLVKAFPSLHTGLSVLAAIYARKTDATYQYTVWGLVGLILFSTLYLGVHWLTDLLFGSLLVPLAYGISRWVALRPERSRRGGRNRRIL